MQFLATVALFPLVLWLLSLGCGLLLERLTGTLIAAPLVLPLGFAALVAVSQFTLWWGLTAPLTPGILLVLALIGFVLARRGFPVRWRARRRGWWLGLAPGIATYLLVAAPEIVAGRATFSGYLLDTTGAIQVAGGERLLHYGHSFLAGVPAYGTTLSAYFGNGYPSGGQGLMAAAGWLTGQGPMWLYSVFQALELGMLALVLGFVARRAGISRLGASITGTLAAAPALVYAYALMGSIKELTALPAIALMGALITCAPDLRRAAGLRGVLPFAVAGAAALDSIGIAASPWVLLFGALALIAAMRPRIALGTSRVRYQALTHFAFGGVSLAVATALVGLPTVGPLSKTLTLAESVSNSDATAVSDPGNLLRPLKFLQTLGVWLGESHRVEPRFLNQTYIMLGVMIACVALGVVWLLRRRAWSVIAFVAGSLVVWYVLHRHATTWTDAKLLLILSPVIVLLALIGAFGIAQVRRFEGGVLVGLLAIGILLSDGLLYHGTNLAPTQRYTELETINARFARKGPTLTPDFDEYDFATLPEMEVDGPGLAYAGPFEFVGTGRAYGHSYDLDTLALSSVERFPTIVMRRSPAWSRPPGNFALAWKGRFYTVWRRRGAAPREHIPLGGSGFQPASVVSCRQLVPVARRAERLGARIAFAERPLNVQADLVSAAHSANVGVASDVEGRAQLLFGGPARVEGGFRVPRAGRYELWLGGSVDRPLNVLVDGRRIGAPAAQSGDDGSMIYVGRVTLSAGRHSFELMRGGGDLRPDDTGSTAIDGFVLEPLGAESEPVGSVPARDWRSLCGRPLDWLEIT